MNSTSKCEFSEKLRLFHISYQCKPDFVEFNPWLEKEDLLKKWLIYRGVSINNKDDIFQIASEEIQRSGKPFCAFSDFDPKVASLIFLKAWLSCFGVTGNSMDKNWWIERVKKVFKLMEGFSKKESLLKKFQKLIDFRKLLRKQNQKISLLNLQLSRLTPQDIDVINDNGSTKTILTSKQKESWFVKQLLARAIEGSAIAIPLLLYQPKSKDKESKTLFQATVEELPRLAARSFILTTHPQHLANAVLSDLEKNQVPVEVSKVIAQDYLKEHPQALRAVEVILLPSIRDVAQKTSK